MRPPPSYARPQGGLQGLIASFVGQARAVPPSAGPRPAVAPRSGGVMMVDSGSDDGSDSDDDGYEEVRDSSPFHGM